jgi:thioredoxin 2
MSAPAKPRIDAAPRLAQRFEVRAVPTLLVMRDGEVIARQPGAVPVVALRRWLDQALQPKDGDKQ